MIKKYFKCLFKAVGLDVRRYHAGLTPSIRLVSLLKKFEINMVLDVGANTGQFASEIRDAGYAGSIISFEPLSTAYTELTANSEFDAKWTVYPRSAIGDHIGLVDINIAGNSASSSLLPMLGSHLEAAPHSAYIGKEAVELLTLDAISYPTDLDFKKTFLKIDTQGFEWAVLDGARDLLQKINGISLELSLTPLYEGQHLWGEIIERLERLGFILWALEPEFIDPNSGRVLQMNGIFFRDNFLSQK